MDRNQVIENSLTQLDYYNNDQGRDLAPVFHGPSRARFANIAACLVDGNRFADYMQRSSYWETDLITAARIYISKPELGRWRHEPDDYQAFLSELREHLIVQIPRKRIYQNPQRLNYQLDLGSVNQMLKQIWLEGDAKS